jgi:hypothetical protein
MSLKPHHSSSPQHKNLQDKQKLFPYISENRRLTVLLQECTEMQNLIEKTKNSINHAGSSSVKKLKVLNLREKSKENDLKNKEKDLKFKEDYEKFSKKLKGKQQISDAQKAVDSLIKTISQIKRKGRKDQKVNEIRSAEKNFIGLEVLQTDEARKLLQNNKRPFGDHFAEGLKKHENTSKKNKISTALHCLPKNLKSILSSPQLSLSRGLQSPSSMTVKEQNLFSSVLNSNRKISHMVKVEKLLHEKALRLN